MVISNYTDISQLKTGPAFILIVFGIFITLLFSVSKDFKVEKGEINLLIFVTIALIGSVWALKNYFPQIFSIFPDSTKQIFSSIGVYRMIEKGSMLWMKKIVGISLVLLLLNIDIPIPYIREATLILAAYFLLISGRRL